MSTHVMTYLNLFLLCIFVLLFLGANDLNDVRKFDPITIQFPDGKTPDVDKIAYYPINTKSELFFMLSAVRIAAGFGNCFYVILHAHIFCCT